MVPPRAPSLSSRVERPQLGLPAGEAGLRPSLAVHGSGVFKRTANSEIRPRPDLTRIAPGSGCSLTPV